MTGKTISHYRIVDKLGEGGMGVVYRATDLKLDRSVALKLLSAHLSSDADARNRFLREAKAADPAMFSRRMFRMFPLTIADGLQLLA